MEADSLMEVLASSLEPLMFVALVIFLLVVRLLFEKITDMTE